MELTLCILVALPAILLAVPVTMPPPASNNSPPPDSFQNFANLHLTPETTTDDDVPIGFHIQLGHNATVSPGQSLQLSNYQGLMRGLLATGPLAFEAYNGSYCPPVTGYYYMAANIHLVSSLDPESSKNETSPLVTVSICLFGFCSSDTVASLETYSRTSGLHTVSVSGILSLKDTDRLVLQVSTGNGTTAAILTHSSFMGFLWGRSRSSQ